MDYANVEPLTNSRR